MMKTSNKNALVKTLKDAVGIRRNLVLAKPMPLSIAVNITGRCNLRCEFCEKSRAISHHELDFQSVKKLIDFSRERDCPIFISGGEPFLHKSIWNILRYCKDIGKKVSCVTNGTLFDNLSPEQYRILSDTINMMSVSLDSTYPEEHDRMRGAKGSFDKVARFLNNPLRKNKVGIISILTPELKNIQEMIEFAKKTKCSLNFQLLIFESNFPEVERLEWKKETQKTMSFSPEKMRMLQRLNKYAEKLKVTTNLSLIMKYIDKYYSYANTDKYFCDHVLNKFMCFVPFQQLTVDEKGLIVPCVFLQGERSINEGSLLENWQDMALKYREALKNGKKFPACRSCSCHFAENFRSSIIAYPVANASQLPWLISYYLKRLLQGEGRKA